MYLEQQRSEPTSIIISIMLLLDFAKLL